VHPSPVPPPQAPLCPTPPFRSRQAHIMPVYRFKPLGNLQYVTTAMAHQPHPCLFSHFPTRSPSPFISLTHSQPICLHNHYRHYFFRGLPQLAQDRCQTPGPSFPRTQKIQEAQGLNRPLLAVAGGFGSYVPFSLLPTHVINITHRF